METENRLKKVSFLFVFSNTPHYKAVWLALVADASMLVEPEIWLTLFELSAQFSHFEYVKEKILTIADSSGELICVHCLMVLC